MDHTPSPQQRYAALERRKAALAEKLAQARQAVCEAQEEMLLLVPQELLHQVKAGTVNDFRRIHEQTEAGLARDFKSFSSTVANLDTILSNIDAQFGDNRDQSSASNKFHIR